MFLTLQKKFQTTNAKHSAVSRSNLQEQQGGEQEEKIWLSLYFIWIFPNMYSWVTYMIKTKKRIQLILKYFQNPLQVKMLKKNIFWIQKCEGAVRHERENLEVRNVVHMDADFFEGRELTGHIPQWTPNLNYQLITERRKPMNRLSMKEKGVKSKMQSMARLHQLDIMCRVLPGIHIRFWSMTAGKRTLEGSLPWPLTSLSEIRLQ